MNPSLIERHKINEHEFTAIKYQCDTTVEGDAFFTYMVEMARNLYGEYLIDEVTDASPSVANTFNLEAIKTAIRRGMPNPQDEETKPSQLRCYRSEAAELVARKALADSYGFIYPASSQVTKGNASQPVLGFDGWGLIEVSQDIWAFVVIQVKGSDENKSPPSIADKLFDECSNAPSDMSKVCRALTAIISLVKDEKIQNIIFRMLESIGNNENIRLVVAPVIVRGKFPCNLSDVINLETAVSGTEIHTKASSASIGVELELFGRTLFEKARSNDQ